MPKKENAGIEEAVPTVDTNVSETSTMEEVVPSALDGVDDFGLPNGNDDFGKLKKKGKGKLIALIITIVAALGGIGYFIYYKINTKPEKIMKDVVEEGYKDFSDALKELEDLLPEYNPLEDSIKVTGEVSVGGDLFKDLKNDSISFEAGFDLANQKFEASASVKEKDKKLLDATVFGKNKKMYIKSDSLLKGVYYVDEFDLDDYFDLDDLKKAMNQIELPSFDDVDLVVRSLTKAFEASLDEDAMEKSKEEVKVNKVKVNTNKVSYQINSKTANKFAKSMLKELKKDSKLLSTVAEIAKVDVDQVEELLEQAEDNLDESAFDGMPKAKFNVYTTGSNNNLVKVELKAEGVTISYAEYKDNYYLEVTVDEESLEIVGETKNDVTTIDVKFDDTTYATFKVRAFDVDYIDFDYDIDIPEKVAGTTIKAEGSLKIKLDKESKKEMSGMFEFSIDATIDKYDFNASGKLDFKVEVGADIADYSTSGAKSVDDMTEADADKVKDALKDLENSDVYKFIEKNIGENFLKNIEDTTKPSKVPNYNYSYGSGYDYNYDDDDNDDDGYDGNYPYGIVD